MKRQLCCIFIASLFLLNVFCNYKLHAAVVDKIVVIVNEDVITQSEIDQLLLPLISEYQTEYKGEQLYEKIESARRKILERLIEDRLIVQEAKKQKIEVDEQEVAERLNEVIMRFPSEEEFQDALSKQAITMKNLSDKYREQIMGWRLISREVRSKISVSPSEIAAYYNSHLDDFNVKESVRVKNILIRFKPTKNQKAIEAKAQKIYSFLKKGVGFEKLAKRYSEGAGASNGGDLGYVQKDELLKEIDDIIFKLEPHQTSELIKTDLGYHIVKVEDKKKSQTEPLVNVQDKIKELLLQDKFNAAYQDWIGKLKKNAYIQIR